MLQTRRDGFVDNEFYVWGTRFSGVFISDVPIDCNEGAKGNQLLEVILLESLDLSDHELIEEEKPYREWDLPAENIKRYGKVRLLSSEEEGEAIERKYAD